MTKAGLGYVGTDVAAGLYLAIDRLHESRGELSGELLVERVPEGHLLRGRFNVSSIGTRKSTAAYLASRANGIDWADALEQFCLRVLDLDRTGAPFTTVGRNEPRAEEPYLLAPFLRAGAPTILFGEGGSGKSLLAAAAALSVATGVPAFAGWEVPAPRPVLVIDWESDQPDWNERIQMIAAGLGIEPPEIHYRHGAGLSLIDQVQSVAQQVAQHDVALVIVDSVGMASPSAREGVDANDTTIRLFKALASIGSATAGGTASLLVDHVSKVGAEREGGAVRPYGSIFKVNLARSVFELRVGPTFSGVRHLALVHRKVNRGPVQEAIGIAIEYRADRVRLDREDPMWMRDGTQAAAMAPWLRIQAYLEDVGPQKPIEIARALDMASNKVRTELGRHDVFHRWDDGRYTSVTAYFAPTGATSATESATDVAASDDPARRTGHQGGAQQAQQEAQRHRDTGPLLRSGDPRVARPRGTDVAPANGTDTTDASSPSRASRNTERNEPEDIEL